MKVVSKGFKASIDSADRLQVALASSLSPTLQLGTSAEVIEVSGTASLLNTESAASGINIAEEKIQSLPLNGRQFIQLALLVAGTNSGGRQVQQNNARLNQTGGRTNNNLFLLDAAANTDPDHNALSYVPIVDRLAEFQLQSAQYGAQYGRASGSQINVVSKSGSNAFHGSAWEFLRNQKLDSRPFDSVTSQLLKNQRNQFGGTLGGAILKDKLFFFGAYKRLTLRQAGVGLTTVAVPTDLERKGDFSKSIAAFFDPDTLNAGSRTPFPGNVIPSTCINAFTQTAMSAMPLPYSGGNNYVNSNGIVRQDGHNGSGRIDYNLSTVSSIFGRYSISDENSTSPDVVTDRDRLGFVRPQNIALGWNRVLGATKVNELRLGFNRLFFQDGLPEPRFDIGGTVLTRNNTYQIYDNFTRTLGRQRRNRQTPRHDPAGAAQSRHAASGAHPRRRPTIFRRLLRSGRLEDPSQANTQLRPPLRTGRAPRRHARPGGQHRLLQSPLAHPDFRRRQDRRLSPDPLYLWPGRLFPWLRLH